MSPAGKPSERRASRPFFAFRVLPALLLLSFLLPACSSLFYYPSRVQFFDPAKMGFPPREVNFTASDGTKLFGWFFAARVKDHRPVQGTIIQFHGNAENLSSHFLSLLWAVEHGYNLFTFSYRGYGKSEGEPNQKGTYLDGLAALEQAWRLNGGAPRFIVHGQSLGGAIAARALADFPHKDQTSLLVLDSTFASYQDVARRKLASHWLTWVFSPLAMVLVSDSYSAEESIRELRTPLLVIHDREDPAVPIAASEEFFDEATHTPWKQFWKLDQGRHVGAFALDRGPDGKPATNVWRQKYIQVLDGLPNPPQKFDEAPRTR